MSSIANAVKRMASSVPLHAFGIGHRGARLVAKENTLQSFRKCVEMGIAMIEFDINITSDNVLVIYHDDTMPDNRCINQMTFAEFQAYDADFPSLNCLMTDPIIIDSPISLYFDIKDRLVPVPLMSYLAGLIKKSPSLGPRIWIASFTPEDVTAVIAMRAEEPALEHISVGGLFEDVDDHYLVEDASAVYGSMGYNFLSIKENMVSQELVTACHEQGMAVFCWVTNTEEVCERLLAMEIDGFCGDDMDLLQVYQLKSAASKLPIIVAAPNGSTDVGN